MIKCQSLIRDIVLRIGYLLSMNKNASKVIFYHDIKNEKYNYTDMATDFELFKKHIECVKINGFNIVPEIKQLNNEIQICFDDGFRGIWYFRDFFRQEKIRPTVFLALHLIGTPGFLTILEIKELLKMGFIFQSHTCSHQDLTSLLEKDMYSELQLSRIELSSILEYGVDEICFPIGYYSNQICKAGDEIGYRKMYSSIPGNYFDRNKDGVVYRNLVQFLSKNNFEKVLFGGMNILSPYYKFKHKKIQFDGEKRI